MRAMNEKIMMDVEGKFWTRQNELVEELEYTLHISRANRTMWIDSVD